MSKGSIIVTCWKEKTNITISIWDGSKVATSWWSFHLNLALFLFLFRACFPLRKRKNSHPVCFMMLACVGSEVICMDHFSSPFFTGLKISFPSAFAVSNKASMLINITFSSCQVRYWGDSHISCKYFSSPSRHMYIHAPCCPDTPIWIYMDMPIYNNNL